MSRKALVVLSGGQDSTYCLYWALMQGWNVHAITFDYGQRHKAELQAADAVRRMAHLPAYRHEYVRMGRILEGTSPLVSNTKLEQYPDHQSLPGGLEKTFVPMRNQLFLTIAANRAYCMEADALVTGVCQEDSGGYPDCRQEFITALQSACNLGTFCEAPGGALEIVTPLMYLTKAQSIHKGLELPGCYAAWAYSHTAYDGAYPPVGHDHATLLRAKGFEEADVPDPLILRAVREGLMELPRSDNYSADKVAFYSKSLV